MERSAPRNSKTRAQSSCNKQRLSRTFFKATAKTTDVLSYHHEVNISLSRIAKDLTKYLKSRKIPQNKQKLLTAYIVIIAQNYMTVLNSAFVQLSWSLTFPFNTNMAISEIKGQGWRAIPIQWRKASNILTSTLAAFLFSSHPKGKGIERLI